MAGRQPSQSMSYVPMDVNFDHDPKFIRLMVDFGANGKTFLSRKQAKAAADELRDMMEVFF